MFINGQSKFSITPELILRTPSLKITDPGGYLIADQFNRRLTYGLTMTYEVSEKINLTSGVRRIFFVNDENYWFKSFGTVLFIKGNPTTGFQIPVGISYNLLRLSNRFQLIVGAAMTYNQLPQQSGTGGLRLVSSTNTIIQSSSSFSVKETIFWTMAPSINLLYRVKHIGWISYTFEQQISLSKEVLAMQFEYNVETPNSSNNYRASSSAAGSGRHHSIGLRINF
ncbi:MAG: hypothetical protein KF763_01280 [Cyclobacteriaceae bacterium]|nr:hypothetical protein [Cyclobacteriaceae bacterium]